MSLSYTKSFNVYRFFVLRFCSLALLVCISSTTHANEGIWLLIDTQALTLEVKKGEKTLERMNNIAIGRNGAGFKSYRGDNITPLGMYRIGWVNPKSTYHRFFGLSYPSLDNAFVAYQKGLIGSETYYAIVGAHQQNKIPLQNTPLGGQIGIHGIGRGDEKLHKTMNWTHGCIALTNRQIDRLSHWVDEHVLVQIK